MKTRLVALFLLTFLMVYFISSMAPGYADTVTTYDGRKIRGEIIEETKDHVKVKTKFGGTITVERYDIAKIERDKEKKKEEPVAKSRKLMNQYKDRLQRAEKEDRANAFHELGEWCDREGLKDQAIKAYERALELDPYFVPAHRALGHILIEGNWMTEKEAEAKGYVKNSKGRWVSKETLADKEKKKLEAERREAQKAEEKKKKEYEGVPWDQRHIIKTEHYEIHCNSTRKQAEAYSKIMEALFAKYAHVFRALKPEKRRSRVYINRNQREFMEMWRKPMGVGGFYRPDSRDLYSYHGSFGVTGTTLTVLAHEGCHQFQHLFVKGDMYQFATMPIWCLEGMAVIFEAAEVSRTGKVKLEGPSPDRIKQLQQMIPDEKHITLREMLDTPRMQFGGSHYNTAGAFTWWLLKTSKKKRYLALYEKYLLNCVDRAQRDGGRSAQRAGPGFGGGEAAPFEALAQEIAGKNLEDLEKEWRKYVLKIRLPKLGRLSGDTYKSKELGFEITRPSRKWESKKEKELSAGTICCFEIPIPGAKKDDENKSYAQFSVVSYGNSLGTTADESLESWEDDVKRNLEQQKRYVKDTSKHVTDFKVVEKKKMVISGYDAAMFLYEIKIPESKWNRNLTTNLVVTVYTTERIYRLSGAAQSDKYDEYKDDFMKMVESMIIEAD
ncbi:MAG: tetratricopeptide repeat protein [Planctomycetota bacterium]|jgi:tetratricopeptide (TPR) repeat protein